MRSSMEVAGDTITDFVAFVNRNPISPSIVVLLTTVLIAQLLALQISEELFSFLFVAQLRLDFGLFFAPLSHAAFLLHFVPNVLLFLLFGWAIESVLSRKEFLVVTIAAAYIPTYMHMVYSYITVGTVGTLGFSGVVYALPPIYVALFVQNYREIQNPLQFGVFWGAVVLTLMIPLSLVGIIDLDGVLPGAWMTHAGGFAIGMIFSLVKFELEACAVFKR